MAEQHHFERPATGREISREDKPIIGWLRLALPARGDWPEEAAGKLAQAAAFWPLAARGPTVSTQNRSLNLGKKFNSRNHVPAEAQCKNAPKQAGAANRFLESKNLCNEQGLYVNLRRAPRQNLSR